MRHVLASAFLSLVCFWSFDAAADMRMAAGETPDGVIACASLVDLRLLMGAARDDRGAAARHLSDHPGCRAVARDRVGEARNRAMIGGAPFECLAIKDEDACGWVMP